YSDTALKSKEKIVSSFFKLNDFNIVWDLGANDGRFSRIVLENGASLVISFDLDAIAVEKNYQLVKKYKNSILPLLLDLTNPSPGLGFANRERLSIEERQKPDCIVALALIHHLAISNNAPFEKIAEWLALLSDNLIIEFVPKEDSQVQVLLATRDDIFLNYTKSEFEKAFQHYFDFIRSENILNSERVIYHLRKKREHE
ncbi:MAG TPA: SAM-dependent methyltransferase, partial [Syntrophomonas sp.]|nr:SAM-dependent methyltransferase [Syntrophomonas sp.]